MGSASVTAPEIAYLKAAYPQTRVEELRGLSAAAMVEALSLYDAVICPASTILIESLALGKPAVTGYFVSNQHHLADYVHAHQQAYSVGNFMQYTGLELNQALGQGVQWLMHTPRQPYVTQFAPEQLRHEFQLLQSC
ncbi:hypothetical protein GCM10011378_17950 [Hymenobacter glacieicola]|uniref:Glycosyl transferase family 28 C-terminal domain-containing protein n=2 Tax=Hymenobacter glacieicola TaxID=1562124 RepID=A0ABQ1WQP0_9BACT|nr:hypothetical protein GCM10011378_17950 [Hymenobacter glacieicola]